MVESLAAEIKCWQMQGFVYRVKECNWLYILPGRRQWSNRAGEDILYEGFGVIIDCKLKFQDQIKQKINKAHIVC